MAKLTHEFNAQAAREARDTAIAQVDQNANEIWKLRADAAIDAAAKRHHELTSDDVWIILDKWGIPRPREARALGPRMIAAAKRGSIEATPYFRASIRVELHASPRRVYESQIYRGDRP